MDIIKLAKESNLFTSNMITENLFMEMVLRDMGLLLPSQDFTKIIISDTEEKHSAKIEITSAYARKLGTQLDSFVSRSYKFEWSDEYQAHIASCDLKKSLSKIYIYLYLP